MKYGGILKACRERAGLNQEELAFQLHMSQSDVSKYENNIKEPTISTFRHWMNQTQTHEVMIAFLCGVDGLGAMQQVLEVFNGPVGAIVTNLLSLM